MLSIQEFCDKHAACGEGREWAMANCTTMQDVWDTAKPEWLIWVATMPGVLDDKTLRRFACWSVRQVWYLLTDQRSRDAVEVAERHAGGLATDAELSAARAAARAAAGATWDAAWAAWAARAAARAAAGAAAGTTWAAYAAAYAADGAAYAAAGAAAYAADGAAYAAAGAAAYAALDAQAAWLRQNAIPDFTN